MMTLTDVHLDWLCARVPDAAVSAKGGRSTIDKRRALRGIFGILPVKIDRVVAVPLARDDRGRELCPMCRCVLVDVRGMRGSLRTSRR